MRAKPNLRSMPEEKYIIKRDRLFMLAPAYWNAISHSSRFAKKIYGATLKFECHIFNTDGRMQVVFEKKNWDKTGYYISLNLFSNEKYFKKIEKKINQETNDSEKFLKEIKIIDFSKLSFRQLINLAKRIKKVWLDYDVANIFSWYVGGDKFKDKVEKYLRLSENDFLFLTTPTARTAISRLEYDLLKCSLRVKENTIQLEKAAGGLSEKYGWIPFGYDGLEYWDKKYFIEKLKKGTKKSWLALLKQIKKIEKMDDERTRKRNKLIKKHKLSGRKLNLINKINVLAVWTDERKKIDFRLHYYYSLILTELAKRYAVPYKNLKYLFTNELEMVLKNKARALQISDYRINNQFAVKFGNDKGGIISEKEKKEILSELNQQYGTSEIKGIVVSRGNKRFYKCAVKIILSPKQSGKIKKGDFLVAPMTTPDYIISMRKAAGFITEEGGITCHAAIIAREMNKPCIIGTKVATKVLKDGDVVEVDAERGVVKVLKKNKTNNADRVG